MKLSHKIMKIFYTEFSKFPRRGLDHTYKTSFNFRMHFGFSYGAADIVPVYSRVHWTNLTKTRACIQYY
jgi:hypothetical protein